MDARLTTFLYTEAVTTSQDEKPGCHLEESSKTGYDRKIVVLPVKNTGRNKGIIYNAFHCDDIRLNLCCNISERRDQSGMPTGRQILDPYIEAVRSLNVGVSTQHGKTFCVLSLWTKLHMMIIALLHAYHHAQATHSASARHLLQMPDKLLRSYE
jgi:hypothetical protein